MGSGQAAWPVSASVLSIPMISKVQHPDTLPIRRCQTLDQCQYSHSHWRSTYTLSHHCFVTILSMARHPVACLICHISAIHYTRSPHILISPRGDTRLVVITDSLPRAIWLVSQGSLYALSSHPMSWGGE
jgi:hypothetical protein